ncbi:MAG: autotransporter-associated beta strand repeat-containing protein, partial [Prosthecobacter sp.]
MAAEVGDVVGRSGAGLDSGGLLALVGEIPGISGPGKLTTSSNRELMIFTPGAATTLDIGSSVGTFTGGLTKAGEGTLTLSALNFYRGATRVNEGTLRLDAGTNTIMFNNDFFLQGEGILDLNGNTQVLSRLLIDATAPRNATYIPGSGGTVTSSTAATLGIASGNGNFAGNISGAISVVRSTSGYGTTDWNLYSANDYTGKTILNGGRTILRIGGTLSDTSSIDIVNSTLYLFNNDATGMMGMSIDDRVNDTASILLRGGMIQYRARNGFEGSETFGELTVGAGNSFIDVAEPGTNINSSTVTFADLLRTDHGTLRFVNVDGIITNSRARVYFDKINGVTINNVGDGLVNDIIGGWAVFERDFASYTPGTGVGGLNSVGYAGYSPNSINDAGAAENVRLTFPNVASEGIVGSNVLSISSTAGLQVGDAVLGTGIAAGAKVVSIDPNGTDFTISVLLGANNPSLNIPEVVTLTGDRTINSLAMVVSGDSTLDLGSNTLNLVSGGLIASQGFDHAPSVTVVTSSTSSNIITVSTIPNTLVVGSSILGATVVEINGLSVTLSANANANTTTPTSRGFFSALYMPISIENGNLTAGGTAGPADLYLHALGYVNGSGDVYNRDVYVGANIVDNGTGAVSLVINASEGRTSTGFGTSELFLSGNNTYTGGTFVNGGKVLLQSQTGRAFSSGDVTISGGMTTNGTGYRERSSLVLFGADDQINSTAMVTLNGGGTLDLNGFDQTFANLVFNNDGGNSPTLNVWNGNVALTGDITATSSNLGGVSEISSGILYARLVNGSNQIVVETTGGIAVGALVTGTNIRAGTRVVAIDAASGTLTLSDTATGTANRILTFSGSGGLDLGSTSHTFNVAAVKASNGVADVLLAPLQPTLNVTANLFGTGTAGIVKTGDGVLQLGGASTFGGGVDLQSGGILFGASSEFNSGVPGQVSAGPVGTGVLTIATGTTLLTDANRTIGNDVDASAASSFTIDSISGAGFNLTLTGEVTLANTVGIAVVNPDSVAALSGSIKGASGGVITINKTGLGTLALGEVNALNTVTLNLNGGSLSLLNDGDGTGSTQVIDTGITLVPTGPISLTIGRSGARYAPLFATASNKTLRMAAFALSGPLAITNNNGYGLELTGPVTLDAGQRIGVSGSSTSNTIDGLTFTGLISGDSGIIKTGSGTLVLRNSGNNSTFGS